MSVVQLLNLYNIKFNGLKLLKDERSKNKRILFNFIVNRSIIGQALLFSHAEFLHENLLELQIKIARFDRN